MKIRVWHPWHTCEKENRKRKKNIDYCERRNTYNLTVVGIAVIFGSLRTFESTQPRSKVGRHLRLVVGVNFLRTCNRISKPKMRPLLSPLPLQTPCSYPGTVSEPLRGPWAAVVLDLAPCIPRSPHLVMTLHLPRLQQPNLCILIPRSLRVWTSVTLLVFFFLVQCTVPVGRAPSVGGLLIFQFLSPFFPASLKLLTTE